MIRHRSWLAASAILAVLLYALIWIGYVQQWEWLAAIDSSALDFFHRYGVSRPGWVMTWDVFCTVLGPTMFRLLGVVLIVVALTRRNMRIAMFLLISIELSGLIVEVAKQLSDRPRPATALVTAPSSSFPSGHALGVMVAVLALLIVVWPIARRPLRLSLIASGAVIVVTIGLGRVVLNVHHPTDVVAGWALGYAYFVACLLLVTPTRPVTVADETPATPGTSR